MGCRARCPWVGDIRDNTWSIREEKGMAMKGLSKQEIEARMNQQKTLLVQNTGAPQRDGLNKLKAILRIYKGYILKPFSAMQDRKRK